MSDNYASMTHTFFIFQPLVQQFQVWTSRAISYLTNCRMEIPRNLLSPYSWKSQRALLPPKTLPGTWRAEWRTPRQFSSFVTGRKCQLRRRKRDWTPSLRASSRKSQSRSGSPRFWTLWRNSHARVKPRLPRDTWNPGQLL